MWYDIFLSQKEEDVEMTKKTSTNQLFMDLVDYIEIECEKHGIDNLFDIVEGKARQLFLGKQIEETNIQVFMYQVAFAVSMRHRAKNPKSTPIISFYKFSTMK